MPPKEDTFGILKWVAGLVIACVTTGFGVASWAESRLSGLREELSAVRVEIRTSIESHRLKELHTNHPSKDAFDSVQKEIAEVRRVQDRILETQRAQNEILLRIAEKVGVR